MRKLVISALLLGTVSGAFAQTVTTKIQKPSAWQKIKENTSMFFWSEFRGGNIDKPGNEFNFDDQGNETTDHMNMWFTVFLNYKLSETSTFTINPTFTASSNTADQINFEQTRIAYRKKFKISDAISLAATPRINVNMAEGAKNDIIATTGTTRYGEVDYVDAVLSGSYDVNSAFNASLAVTPRFYNLRIGSGDRYRVYTASMFTYNVNDNFGLYAEFNFAMHNDRNDVITHMEEREGRAGEDLVLALAFSAGSYTVKPFLSLPTNSGSNSENTTVGFRLMGSLF